MASDKEKGHEKQGQSSEMPSNYVYKPWPKSTLSLAVEHKDHQEQTTTKPKKPQQE